MTSDNENAPPSYNEAMSQANRGSAHDEARPDGWVEGYVEPPPPPSTALQAAGYQPPAPLVDDKSAAQENDESSDAASSDDASKADSTHKPAAASKTPDVAFGGLTLGAGKVLGFGYGSNVSGAGLKIGPLMLGVVDRDAPAAAGETDSKS